MHVEQKERPKEDSKGRPAKILEPGMWVSDSAWVGCTTRGPKWREEIAATLVSIALAGSHSAIEGMAPVSNDMILHTR